MTSSDDSVGIHNGHAAWAAVAALDLSTQYAGLDSLWNVVIADSADGAGQAVVATAIQAYGCAHLPAMTALMSHVGALSAAMDTSVQSGMDVDDAGAADFGAVVGALAIGVNPGSGA